MNGTALGKLVMLAVCRGATRIFRNNTAKAWVGEIVKQWRDAGGNRYMTLKNPRILHAGLVKGAADYIGFKTVTVTPDMIGMKVAVFTSIEVKAGSDRIRTEQNTWMQAVQNAGGIAGIARSPEDAAALLDSWPPRPVQKD